jgi:tRNA(His) 5'-end guanylyltransferase
MPVNDELGKRMKEFYEQVPKTRLVRRTPVAIRIDGKAFHTFTRGFARPFDDILIKSMQNTMKYLCENIQGCVLGYHQSDEITLILVDYKKLTSSAWFEYEIQKMTSIAASMATMAFNKFFAQEVARYDREWKNSLTPQSVELQQKHQKYLETLRAATDKGAMFDARVFNIPKEEVTNLVYWRQLDAARNSVQMVGQSYFSHKQLQNKSCNQIQDMLMTEKGINWNNFPAYKKRGSCCIKSETTTTAFVDGETKTVERPHWYIDLNIPQFKNEGREYIDKLIRVGDDCSCPCGPISIY